MSLSRDVVPTVYLGFGGSFLAQLLGASTYYKFWLMRIINAGLSVNQQSDGLPNPPAGWSSGDSLTLHGTPLVNQPSAFPDGGSAIRLNGTSQYLSSVYDETAAPTDIGPQTMWVVLTVHALPGAGVEPAILGGSTEFALTLRSDGRVYGYYNGAAVVDLPITLNVPQHIVLTRSDASPDSVKLYVNSAAVDTATPANGTINRGFVHLGKHWTNAHYLNATYFGAGFFPIELSAAQVLAQYDASRWTDVTAELDVMATVPIVIERGIKDDNPIARVAATGVASFALENGNTVGLPGRPGHLEGYYTPGHVNCRAGFQKGIPCKISMSVGAEEYTQFVGRVRVISPVPDEYGEQITTLVATDWLDEAARFRLAGVGILEDVRADEVFEAIVERMPNQPHGLTVHACSEVYELALTNSRDEAIPALEEFVRLQSSEVGRAWVSRVGSAVWESRYTRPTWHADVLADIETNMLALDAQETTDAVVNRVEVTVHPKRVDDDPNTVLYTLERPIKIQPGETHTFTATYVSVSGDGATADRVGGLDMQAPIPGSDYAANELTDGTGASRTSGLSVSVTFGANAAQVAMTNLNTTLGGVSGEAAIHVTAFQLRGRGVYDFQPVPIVREDTTAIAADGMNPISFDMVYQEDQITGDAIARALLAAYQLERIRPRRVVLCANEDALPDDLLARDVSDRIALNESMTALDGEYHINGIRVEFSEGVICDVTWWLTTTAEGDALMAWQNVAFSAANFMASAGNWVIDSAEHVTFAWRRAGSDAIDILFTFNTTDVSAAPAELRIAIPGGYTALKTATIGHIEYSDAGGTANVGSVKVTAGDAFLRLIKASGNWSTTSSDNTRVAGFARLPIAA